MSDLKTKANDASVSEFLDSIADDQKRKDCYELVDIMEEITNEKPKMWGNSIVGFGSYTYKYASGRHGEWMTSAFSPRKQNLTIYIMSGFSKFPRIMDKLGKYKTGKSCLYIKSLQDIDKGALHELITASVKWIKEYSASMK